MKAAYFLGAMGARVIALDVDDGRLPRAKEFGADVLINARANDVPDAIRDVTHGEGPECSLGCSGASEARSLAIKAAGTCRLHRRG